MKSVVHFKFMSFAQDENLRMLLEQVYQSKCLELNIENQDLLRNRFIATVLAGLPKGILDFSSQSLKAVTMPYVVELIQALGAQMHTLLLDENPIGDEGLYFLLESIDVLRGYKKISLNSIGVNPEGLITFLTPFEQGAKLECLDLGSSPSAERRNRFNEESSAFLGRFLSRCHTLTHLEMVNTQLRSSNGYNLFKGVESETSIQVLKMQNTGLSNQAIHQLCCVNCKHFTYIRTLDLSGNNTLTAECCQDLAQMICQQRHFHNLHLSGCSELGNGLIEIFQALQYKSADKVAEEDERKRRDAIRVRERTQKLRDLGPGVVNLLDYDRVIVKPDQVTNQKKQSRPESGGESEKTTALRFLDLRDVKLSEKQLQALAEAMQYNQSLEFLSLEGCGIDFNKQEFLNPFKLFCDNTSKSTSLKTLSLSKNVLTDKVNDYIWKLLKIPTLELLNLNFCRLHDDACVNIAKQLIHCKKLKKLLMQGNNCDQAGAAAFLVNLQEYTRLHVLDLNLNRVSFQLQEKITALIKQNIDQSCTDVYTELQNEHNRLTEQVGVLNETEFKLQESFQKQAQLFGEIKEKAQSLLTQNEEYETTLEAERTKYDQLVKEQTKIDQELQNIANLNQELNQKVENEQLTFDGKRKQIKEKQKNAEAKIEELDEQLQALQNDPELAAAQKELDKKKKEKENAEREAVVFLAQLAAIEAVLVKEGFLTVAADKKKPQKK